MGAAGRGRPHRQLTMAADDLAEQMAGQLLARWGVVFWDLVSHEDICGAVARDPLERCGGSRLGAWSAAVGS